MPFGELAGDSGIELALDGLIGPARADDSARRGNGDYQRTVTEGAMTGAVSGCATGLIGGLLTGHAQNALTGCIIGGAAGGAGGAVVGDQVAQRKRAYANAEDNLNGQIATARRNTERLKKLVANVDALTERRRSELAALELVQNSTQAEGRLKAALTADLADVDQALAVARQQQRDLTGAVRQYKGTPAGRELNGQVSASNKSIQTLAARRQELQKMQAEL